MSERPILFSGEMVRAILAGKKTMTRRVMRFPKYHKGLTPEDYSPADFWVAHCLNCKDCKPGEPCGKKYWQCLDDILPQQYHPGDRLWVRESWSYITKAENEFFTTRTADGWPVEMLYRSDAVADGWEREVSWKPSIHMPRWASRITLEVVNVRVERVQEIHPLDCVAEGASPADISLSLDTHIENFRNLWNSINAKRGYSWDVNPWVWVVEFRRVDP